MKFSEEEFRSSSALFLTVTGRVCWQDAWRWLVCMWASFAKPTAPRRIYALKMPVNEIRKFGISDIQHSLLSCHPSETGGLKQTSNIYIIFIFIFIFDGWSLRKLLFWIIWHKHLSACLLHSEMKTQQQPLHVATPVRQSLALTKVAGTSVYLKLDSSQPTGSFKIRGIGHLCKTVSNSFLFWLYSDGICPALAEMNSRDPNEPVWTSLLTCDFKIFYCYVVVFL